MDKGFRSRFWKRAKKADCGHTSECLLWDGKKEKRGVVKIPKRGSMTAHRAAWLLEYGEIPEGMWVLHQCDVDGCVNPEHLYVGTPRDNALDRVERNPKPGPRRAKPTTIRFWPPDHKWIRALAKQRRVPVNTIMDEAVALYRKKVESETSNDAVFLAVQRAKT